MLESTQVGVEADSCSERSSSHSNLTVSKEMVVTVNRVKSESPK